MDCRYDQGTYTLTAPGRAPIITVDRVRAVELVGGAAVWRAETWVLFDGAIYTLLVPSVGVGVLDWRPIAGGLSRAEAVARTSERQVLQAEEDLRQALATRPRGSCCAQDTRLSARSGTGDLSHRSPHVE